MQLLTPCKNSISICLICFYYVWSNLLTVWLKNGHLSRISGVRTRYTASMSFFFYDGQLFRMIRFWSYTLLPARAIIILIRFILLCTYCVIRYANTIATMTMSYKKDESVVTYTVLCGYINICVYQLQLLVLVTYGVVKPVEIVCDSSLQFD